MEPKKGSGLGSNRFGLPNSVWGIQWRPWGPSSRSRLLLNLELPELRSAPRADGDSDFQDDAVPDSARICVCNSEKIPFSIIRGGAP